MLPSSLNCTFATPALSFAFAPTETVPLIVALLSGVLMLTVGAVDTTWLLTVTVTVVEVVERLELLVATAVKVCVPLLAVVVSQFTL